MTALPPKGDLDKKIGAFEAPLSVTAQDTPNMTVKIRAGSWFNGAGTFVEYGGGNSPVVSAPVGNPKWVVVALLDAGSVALVQGTPAAAPTLPPVPAGALPLAALYITPTTTAITSALIADVRPFLRTVDVVPNLTTELSTRPTITDMNNALALKADVDGTPGTTFTMNADFTSGSPNADATFAVSRGAAPTVAIRWNESVDLWEFTNDGVTYNAIPSAAGTYAPLVHTHVAADVTDFASATNALIALAAIAQSQVTGLSAALTAKADALALTSHTGNAAIHFTLPIAQADVTGLPAALTGKTDKAGDTMTGSLVVQTAGNQPIALVSDDTGSSGLMVERGLLGADARLEWDETSGAWQAGTVGSMNTLLTGALVGSFVQETRLVSAGAGLTGGGDLSADRTISMPNVGTPVVNGARKITTDAQGRVSATTALVPADISAAPEVHTHVAADVTDFNAAADSRIGAAIGVSVQGFDTDLAALAALSTTGIIARTGAGTYVPRAVTGTASRVVVTDGDGVAGNPTIDVAEAGIDHDALLNFVAAEHVDHTNVVLSAGTGLSGGGDISVSRTFNVAAVKGSQAVTFGAIADGATGDSTNTITVTGAVVGDVVQLGLPTTVPAGFTYQGFVSSANTVTVRAVNNGGATGAGAADATINAIVLTYAEF